MPQTIPIKTSTTQTTAALKLQIQSKVKFLMAFWASNQRLVVLSFCMPRFVGFSTNCNLLLGVEAAAKIQIHCLKVQQQ